MSLYGRWLVALRAIMLIVVVFLCSTLPSAIVSLDPSFGQESSDLPFLRNGSGLYPIPSSTGLPLQKGYGGYASSQSDRVGLKKRSVYEMPSGVRQPASRKPVAWSAGVSRQPLAVAQIDTSGDDAQVAVRSGQVLEDVSTEVVAQDGQVTIGQQMERNGLAAIECKLGSVSDNDFVNHAGIRQLISRFALLDHATQVRLFLLVQARLAQIQAYPADKRSAMGTTFSEDLNRLKNAFAGVLDQSEWPSARDTANSLIFGLHEDDLFDAYVNDRSAIHGLFNLWRSYTTPGEMSPAFFDDMFVILTSNVLPGKVYCMAANSLINHVLTGVQMLRQQIGNGVADENPQHSLENVEGYIDTLMQLKSYFSKIVTGASLALLKGPELTKKLNSISTNLGIIERGSGFATAAKDKNYYLSMRLAVIADTQDVILRGRTVNDQLRDIITRILKLHSATDVNKQEPSYGAFFTATVDLLFFIDAFAGQDASVVRGLISSEVKPLADTLRKQYEVWNDALLNVPMLGSVEYVGAKRTDPIMDIYSKAPTDYSDHDDGRLASVDRLIAFMPYVTPGSGSDAKVGLRVYASQEPAGQPDLANYFESPGKFNASAWQNPHAYASKSGSDTSVDIIPLQSPTSGAASTPAPVTLDLGNMSLDDLENYSRDLFKNADRWMSLMQPDMLSLHKVADGTMRDYGFAIAASWLRTGIALDEVLFLKGKKQDAYAVNQKWKPILALFESYMSVFLQKEPQRFISQVLGDLARTHAYDALEDGVKNGVNNVVGIQKTMGIREMFRKTSGRTKANPVFEPNLRNVDSLSIIGRIEDAFKKANFAATKGIGQALKKAGSAIKGVATSSDEQRVTQTATAAAIATLATLFDPKQSIVADDLFPGTPGNKYLIVDVMLKAGVDYSRIRNLVQSAIIVRPGQSYDLQILKQWDNFFTLFFGDDSRKSSFYEQFARISVTTGVHDLEKRREKIKKELNDMSDISSDALVKPLSFKIRSSEDLKISAAALKVLLEKILRERNLKAPIVGLEALSSKCLGSKGIFLYDEGFLYAKSYSLGKYSDDEIKAALIVLRGMILLLQQPQFTQTNGMGFAVAAHLLAPINYVAKTWDSEMTKSKQSDDEAMLTELFYITVTLLRQVIPDRSSILPDTYKTWNKCSLKPGKANDVASTFDSKYADLAAVVSGKAVSDQQAALSNNSGAIAIAMGPLESAHSALLG